MARNRNKQARAGATGTGSNTPTLTPPTPTTPNTPEQQNAGAGLAGAESGITQPADVRQPAPGTTQYDGVGLEFGVELSPFVVERLRVEHAAGDDLKLGALNPQQDAVLVGLCRGTVDRERFSSMMARACVARNIPIGRMPLSLHGAFVGQYTAIEGVANAWELLCELDRLSTIAAGRTPLTPLELWSITSAMAPGMVGLWERCSFCSVESPGRQRAPYPPDVERSRRLWVRVCAAWAGWYADSVALFPWRGSVVGPAFRRGVLTPGDDAAIVVGGAEEEFTELATRVWARSALRGDAVAMGTLMKVGVESLVGARKVGG